MTKLHLFIALLGLVFAPASFAGHVPPPELKGIETYIESAMVDWKVPGLAIAVVKDDKLVWARGFGRRSLEEPKPVDADTLFAIGSNTKAFTAAAIGILMEAGKLNWD